jgi:hypothetical protein
MVTGPAEQAGPTRYEHILAASPAGGDLGHEQAICDVAAGVAGPTHPGCAAWMLRKAAGRGVARLCFLSRDGQVLYELARCLAPRLGVSLDLEYAYSSRITWSLAATNPDQLPQATWLFNSFIKSNADDVCARLGLPADQCRHELLATGQGASWRVPDAPFLVETFCMGDHGILTRYTRTPTGHVQPVLATRATARPAPGACPYTAPPSTHSAPPSPRKALSQTPTSGPQPGRS